MASLAAALALYALPVAAQQASFVWGFLFDGLNLPECAELNIFINDSYYAPPSPAPVPPYYLMAYAANDPASASPLGSDITKAVWQVNHPAGTKLLIGLADSKGNSGGVASELYTVSPGKTTDCHSNDPSPITVDLNLPGDRISTCETAPIGIRGGTKPYTVTIVAADVPNPKNYTMGAQDNVFDFVNTIKPQTQLIVAVSDAKGVYATSSNLINTSGGTDTKCDGKTSSSHFNSTIGGTGDAKSPTSASLPLGAIIGAAAGGVVLILLIIGLVIFFRRRSKRRARLSRQNGFAIDADHSDRPQHRRSGSDSPDPAITPFLAPPSMHSSMNSSTAGGHNGEPGSYPMGQSGSSKSRLYANHPTSLGPHSNTNSYYQETIAPSTTGYPPSSSGRSDIDPGMSLTSPDSYQRPSVYQHQDAGLVELPPAYGDLRPAPAPAPASSSAGPSQRLHLHGVREKS